MRTDFQTLRTTIADRVLTVTMHRPEVYNALNEAMIDELGEVFVGLPNELDQIRCVVLTGAGRAFGSGQDLRVFAAAYEQAEPIVISEHLTRYHRIVQAMRAAPQPIIAAINGVAAGASANLALACDLRVVAEDARFVEAFARIALVPDAGGPYFLTRLVGVGKALELALLAEEISGREAERIGLVNRCVPAEALASTVRDLATRLANGPTTTYGLIKDLLYRSAEVDLATSLQLEGAAQDRAFATHDHREGVQAFLAKRPPQFTGE